MQRPAPKLRFGTGGFRNSHGKSGLESAKAVLAAKAARVLLVFTTDRLHRNSDKALQYIEEEIVESGLRAIFTRSRIDTDDTDEWRERLKRAASHDESAITMYSENIRAAHDPQRS